MDELNKINIKEIRVGVALPWAAHDEEGRLLLKKGHIIQSQKQLDGLLARGLYRNAFTSAKPEPIKPVVERASPFILIEDFTIRLNSIFIDLESGADEAIDRVLRLTTDIQTVCKEDLNAALGAVHLRHDLTYVLIHPIHTAILCELVSSFLEYPKEKRHTIIAATLTANLGMLKLQSVLQKQKGPLSSEQQIAVQNHPRRSVEILKSAGVDNSLWLSTVQYHHEQEDGSGYSGLKGSEIPEEAKILALVDRYTAMISPRGHRKSIVAGDALKGLFLEKGKANDQRLSLILIKILGVFPPGTYVRLINGDIAIVIKCPAEGKMWPIVKSIITPRGARYSEPLTRDSNSQTYSIKELYIPDNMPPFNLSLLWGYK